MSGRAPALGWLCRRFGCSHREGGGSVVACAAAAPLVLLALAVGADYASVARFRARVQLAADAASLAAAQAVARDSRPGGASDGLAAGAAVFMRRAPRGAAGTPTVAATSRAGLATASVAYAGQAPSNFGAALGYDAISVDASAVSPARLAESGLTAGR